MRALRQLNQFVARQPALPNIGRAFAPAAESDVCPRCGGSPRSLVPVALMCAWCRASIGNQAWRAPITLRS